MESFRTRAKAGGARQVTDEYSTTPDHLQTVSTGNELKTDPFVFTVPEAGVYEIGAKITKYKPTGKFETVRNPDYRWWKFWDVEPKLIQREIYVQSEEWTGKELRSLKVGEQFDLKQIGFARKIL